MIPFPVLSGGHDVVHLLPPWLRGLISIELKLFSVAEETVVNGLSCGLTGIWRHCEHNRIPNECQSIQEIMFYHISEEAKNACKSNKITFPTQSEIHSLLLIGCIAYRIGTFLDSSKFIDAYSEFASFQLDPCGLYKDSKFLLLFRDLLSILSKSSCQERPILLADKFRQDIGEFILKRVNLQNLSQDICTAVVFNLVNQVCDEFYTTRPWRDVKSIGLNSRLELGYAIIHKLISEFNYPINLSHYRCTYLCKSTYDLQGSMPNPESGRVTIAELIEQLKILLPRVARFC